MAAPTMLFKHETLQYPTEHSFVRIRGGGISIFISERYDDFGDTPLVNDLGALQIGIEMLWL
jgi:hypothetical protein